MAEFPIVFTVRYGSDDDHDKKLRIPDGFKNVLEDGFLNIELFVCDGHGSWLVTLVHEECGTDWGIYLDAGWSDFVGDNGLDVGDVLLFTYLGDSSFSVRIQTDREAKKIEKRHDDTSRSSHKKRGRKPAIEGLSSKMIKTNACLTQLAAACQEEYFLFSFSAAHIQQGVINVPLDFARLHFKDFLDTTDVILQNGNTKFSAQLKVTKIGNIISTCSIKNGVNKFIDYFSVQVEEGALIKLRKGNIIIFDVNLVLV
ncbi:uncharacterized protein LOC110721232 [Chenopodium quinoa]|uniref:uncharacterized protein LOC110721232 n=1 Tax=Chenopodium quinoa TaxID=63459 RepID=UPI000B798B0C|nr:uncharacterized protein LOC110721232 [Chenopodium quinoa]